MRAHRACFALLLLSLFSLLSAVHAVPVVKRQAAGSVSNTALVIAISTDAADEAVSTLNQYNQPTDVLVVPQNGTDLPDLTTTEGSVTVGNYGLIIVIGLASYDYSAGWASAITTDQWNTLYAYQLTYGVRMIHLDGYPGNFPDTAMTMGPAGGCCDSSTEEQYVTLLDTSLAPSGPIPTLSTVGLWHYPATITDFNTTSAFILFGTNQLYATNSVAGVIQNFGGRQQMVFFLTGASWSATTNYLGQIWYQWGYSGASPVTISSTALVIATDADVAAEPIFTLNQYNQTYQLLAMAQSGTPLPALTSIDASNNTVANYGLIIVVSLAAYDYGGTTGWASAITTTQWNTLYAYQLLYGIRMIHLDGYPDNFEGTTTAPGPIGCCASDEQLVSVVDTSLLTLSGLSAANLSTLGLWHYPATITDATTTTAFIDFAPNAEFNTSTVAGVLQTFSGRQQMVLFLTGASWSSTTAYLGDVWYSWGYQALPSTSTTNGNSSSTSSAASAARSSALANPITAFTTASGTGCIPNGYFAQYTYENVAPALWCAGQCSKILQDEYTYSLVSTPDCEAFFYGEIANDVPPDNYEFICLLYPRVCSC